jgi:hypothetical protein
MSSCKVIAIISTLWTISVLFPLPLQTCLSHSLSLLEFGLVLAGAKVPYLGQYSSAEDRVSANTLSSLAGDDEIVPLVTSTDDTIVPLVMDTPDDTSDRPIISGRPNIGIGPVIVPCMDQAKIDVGKVSINFGTVNAVDMFKHAIERCGDFSCDGNDLPITSEVINPGNSVVPTEQKEFILQANGHYNGVAERDFLLELIYGAVAIGQDCHEQSYTIEEPCIFSGNPGGPTGGCATTKHIMQCEQANDYSVTRIGCEEDGDSDLRAFLQVTIVEPPKDTNWCEMIIGVLGPAGAALGALPGVQGAAAGAGILLGAVNVFC